MNDTLTLLIVALYQAGLALPPQLVAIADAAIAAGALADAGLPDAAREAASTLVGVAGDASVIVVDSNGIATLA